jgi:hypothetical protein
MEPSAMFALLSARSDPQKIAEASERLRADPTVTALLDAFPSPVMILNLNRQIVAANRSMQDALGPEALDCLGKRPGEVLHCVSAAAGPGGCGTSPACLTCGALRAVLGSQSEAVSKTEEYLLSAVDVSGREGACEYRAVASPLFLDQPFTVLVLQDTSNEKRRAALERIFYHDLLNTAGAMCGLLEIWDDTDSSMDMRGTLHKLAIGIRDEVQSARDLSAAERGDLLVERRPVDATRVIGRILATYEFLPLAHGRRLRYSVSGSTRIETDQTLLHRVLENLVKNALEASQTGQIVMLSYANRGQPCFTVHSQTVIPADIQERIFHRSFTTKRGKGHGIGLHSVRLLTEQYLGGSVSFTTSLEAGTTFTVLLPPSSRVEPREPSPSPAIPVPIPIA